MVIFSGPTWTNAHRLIMSSCLNNYWSSLMIIIVYKVGSAHNKNTHVNLYTLSELGPMSGKNQQLVTDEPVEFEKLWRVEVGDFRRVSDHLRGIYGIYIKWIKKIRKMSTCNQLNLESLGSWPTIYAQKLHGHQLGCCWRSMAIIHKRWYLVFDYFECCYHPTLLSTNFQFLYNWR